MAILGLIDKLIGQNIIFKDIKKTREFSSFRLAEKTSICGKILKYKIISIHVSGSA